MDYTGPVDAFDCFLKFEKEEPRASTFNDVGKEISDEGLGDGPEYVHLAP